MKTLKSELPMYKSETTCAKHNYPDLCNIVKE